MVQKYLDFLQFVCHIATSPLVTLVKNPSPNRTNYITPH